MKKIILTLLIALVGGLIAVSAYKIFENTQTNKLSFEERQQAHFANNPLNIISSAGNPDFTQAAAAVSPAVVHIVTTYESKGNSRGGQVSPFDMFEEFFGRPQGRQQQQRPPSRASGSGVIISDDGYIVTNNHVVEDAATIQVELTDKRTFEAKLIGRDPNTDLALIKVVATGLPIVKFGSSDHVKIGEWVLAVGYPLGLQSTVTAGIVSATGRHLGLLDQSQQPRGFNQDPSEAPISTAIESFIQTDAVINKGNSGGALVNASGELIGINSAIASPSGYYAGYGFAIPVDLVKKISNDFMEFGKVNRGFIGVTFTELNSALAKELEISDINGLYVQSVVPNGGAEKAGLKKGDIITKIDDRLITRSSILQETVARMHPGDKLKLTYKRDGKENTVNVTLQGEDSLKTAEAKADSKSATQIYNQLGAGFVPLSDAKKKEMGLSSGIVLSDVRRGGLFDMYDVPRGLIITKINGKPVNTVDQVESALGASNNNMIRIEGRTQDGGSVQLTFPAK
jgi:Do/DeqQ family serine protease